MLILNHKQTLDKITRMAFEISERHFDSTEVTILGINNNGFALANLLCSTLVSHAKQTVSLGQLNINAAHPLQDEISISLTKDKIENKNIIICDDVSNTGRTLFYSFKGICDTLPKRIEVCVLVDRKHKLFPIHVDYVGLSLATTIQNNIEAHLIDQNNLFAVLN